MLLSLLLACTPSSVDSAALDSGTPGDGAEPAPGEIVDLGDHQARFVWIPTEVAEPEGVVVRIVWPKPSAARTDDGLPVVVVVNGGEKATDVGSQESEIPLEYPGVVEIRVALPGGGKDPYVSGGEDDRRGPDSAQALGDVVGFALGHAVTTEGWTLDELLGQATDPDAVGLLGLSNGGNLALAALADRDDLADTCWVGTWGTPIDAHFATPYMGDQVNDPDDTVDANDDGVPWNDMVDPGYQPWTCGLESCPGLYTDLRFSGQALWGDRDGDGVMGDGKENYDANGNGMRDPDEDMDYHFYTAPDGRKVFALPLLAAAMEAGVFAEPWPVKSVYTWDEAEQFWAERMGVNFIPRIPDGIAAMITGGARGHLHAALDQPDLWVAYELHHQAGRWVRLNADATYLEALADRSGAPERTANISVQLSDLPDDLPEDSWNPVVIEAGVFEMSDRCHQDRWEDDLDAPLTDTQPL